MVGGINKMNYTRLIIGSIIILIGINILFDIDIFRILFPLLLIWLGARIIWGKDNSSFTTQSESREDKLKRILIFSGVQQKVQSDNFEGGEIVTIFGGAEIDLSNAKTKQKQIQLDLVAILGGIKITLPPTWSVCSEGVGILGGFNNQAGKDSKKTVEVNLKGVAILGGVDIVN